MCDPLTLVAVASAGLQYQQANNSKKIFKHNRKDKMKLLDKMQLEDTQLNN